MRRAARPQAPRSTLNAVNRRAGSGDASRQTMLMGLSPSADVNSTGPQAAQASPGRVL